MQKWGYVGGEISSATKNIASQAREAGFNVIRYPSERGLGANLAILKDFERLLRPQMIFPASVNQAMPELYQSINLNAGR